MSVVSNFGQVRAFMDRSMQINFYLSEIFKNFMNKKRNNKSIVIWMSWKMILCINYWNDLMRQYWLDFIFIYIHLLLLNFHYTLHTWWSILIDQLKNDIFYDWKWYEKVILATFIFKRKINLFHLTLHTWWSILMDQV